MNSFYANPFTPDDLRRFNEQQQRSNAQSQNDSVMSMMDQGSMSSQQAMAAVPTTQAMDDYASDTSSTKGIRRQSLPLSYGGNPEQMNGSMRRLSMMNFGGSGSMNQFAFDPALNAAGLDTSMSDAMSGAGQQQLAGNKQQQQQQQNQAGGLSLETHFPGQMDFNALQSSNSATFPSPLDMDLNNPYLDSSGGMQLSSTDINMMNADMLAISDMFNAQQFGSPILNSPMTGTFGQQMYGQRQDPSGNSLDDTGQAFGAQQMASGPSDLEIPNTAAESMQGMPQQSSIPSNQSKLSQPNQMPPPSSNPSKSRTQTLNGQASIGGRSLPWTEPTGKDTRYRPTCRAMLT
jgi:hypothetical protein